MLGLGFRSDPLRVTSSLGFRKPVKSMVLARVSIPIVFGLRIVLRAFESVRLASSPFQ